MVWTGLTGREYTAKQLLELAADMRVEHNADAYREEAARAGASSDGGSSADEEADDEEEEELDLKILGSFRRSAKFAAPNPRAIISLRRLTDLELGISNSLF